MGHYSGQNEVFTGNGNTSDSFAAMIGPCSPHVDLQALRRSGGGLGDDGQSQGGGQKRRYFASYDAPKMEDGPEDADEGTEDGTGNGSQLEKKRRLTIEQVRSLEKNFEAENKLEPERKMRLAKELGLRPRQVAIWFQNRRARWKTKQLERDYETLESDYKRLKADYEQVLSEKNHLKAEFSFEQLQRKSRDVPASKQDDNNLGLESIQTPERDRHVSDSDARQLNSRSSPTVDISRVKDEISGSTDGNSSDIVDADSPRTTNSSRKSVIQSSDFPPESLMGHPQLLDTYPEEKIRLDTAVKLEDNFHEDQSCNYLLLHLDQQSGVLPWWDWP